MDQVKEWVDEEVRRLIGLYLLKEMDAEELVSRLDGLLVAAGLKAREVP